MQPIPYETKVKIYKLISDGFTHDEVANIMGLKRFTVDTARDTFWSRHSRTCIGCGAHMEFRHHFTNPKRFYGCHKCAASKWHDLQLRRAAR